MLERYGSCTLCDRKHANVHMEARNSVTNAVAYILKKNNVVTGKKCHSPEYEGWVTSDFPNAFPFPLGDFIFCTHCKLIIFMFNFS